MVITKPLRIRPSGPPNAKVICVGEAPGEQEERAGIPFIGKSGQDLRDMLRDEGINPSSVYYTNVFLERPENNNLDLFLCAIKEARDDYLPPTDTYPDFPWPGTYDWPRIRGKYVHPSRIFELARLRSEISRVSPNLVIALGDVATWALASDGKFSAIRGTINPSTLVPNVKVLPTRHPAAMYRDWSVRPVIMADLRKAAVEMAFPEIRRPKRIIWMEPTIEDLWEFYDKHLKHADAISIDAEWAYKVVSVVSFAPSESLSISVPFIDKNKPGYMYWSREEMPEALKFVKTVLASHNPKVFQNGNSDMQVFWATLGAITNGALWDTMLIHHALLCEGQKDLGFLGSLYTNEAPWKIMRGQKNQTIKRDE